MEQRRVAIRTEQIDAVVFDMDGVVTDTASVHAAAWARMFDRFLRSRASSTGEPFRSFTEDDYRRYVDGKPRYDGVRGFLASRGIVLPEGEPTYPPDAETVCGLGNRKDQDFLDHLQRDGVAAFPTTVALVDGLRVAGVRTAVVSASRNLDAVLEAGGVEQLFEVRVGGAEAERLGLPGKPDPALFLEAARRLGVVPARTAVVEDALAGVQAGRSGGFGLVVGVDRTGHPEELEAAGADLVVGDLGEVFVDASRRSARSGTSSRSDRSSRSSGMIGDLGGSRRPEERDSEAH